MRAGADGVLHAKWDAVRAVGLASAALGNILFQLTIGYPPFRGSTDGYIQSYKYKAFTPILRSHLKVNRVRAISVHIHASIDSGNFRHWQNPETLRSSFLFGGLVSYEIGKEASRMAEWLGRWCM